MCARSLFILTALLTSIPLLAENPTQYQPQSTDQADQTSVTFEGNREFKIVPLQHAAASSVCDVLNKALNTVQHGSTVALYQDRASNAIVLSAVPGSMEGALSLIRSLDVPAPEEDVQKQVEIVVYELKCSDEQLAALDVDALNRGVTTPKAFLDGLAAFGQTRIFYRAAQGAAFANDAAKLEIGAQAPFVRGTQLSSQGNTSHQVEYENVGCRAEIAGSWKRKAPDQGWVKIRLELSALGESSVDIAKGVMTAVFQKREQQYDGPITVNKPVVIWSVDGSAGKDHAVVYITRIIFSRVQ